MKRFLTLFLVLLCAWVASGGPLDSMLPIKGAAGGGAKFPLTPPLTVSPSSAEIATPGYSFSLVATSPSSGAISYSSSDPTIATVDAAGLVTAGYATGTANITISQSAVGSYFAAAQVVVPVVASWAQLTWNAYDVAIYCDGVDDIASSSASGLPAASSARTIMLWFSDLATNSLGHKFMVYECSPAAGPNNGFGFGFYDSSPMVSFYANSARWTYSRNSDWHHYAAVYPESQVLASISVYIDGELIPFSSVYDGSNTVPNTVVAGKSFQVGGFSRHSENAKGKYAEVAIFNYALSQSEIQYYKNLRMLGNESGLLRLYHCDQYSGVTIEDACGSGYDLTLIGGATWTTKL